VHAQAECLHRRIGSLRPGVIMIRDPLSARKVDGACQAIEAHGAELVHLPPHFPDLNRTEQLFAGFRALLRKATAHSVSNLWAAIGRLLESFEPDECANDFRHAGYCST